MGGLIFLAAAALLIPAAAAAPAAPAQKASQKQTPRDWTRTVVATPEGGFRMGNPNAEMKLVEYISLTCPACARFHSEAFQPLKSKHVASGRVSYELRHYVLNGADVAASLAARCGGAPTFFGRVDYLLRNQKGWFEPFTKLNPEQQQQVSVLPTLQQPLAQARFAGFEKTLATQGIDSAAFQRCLSDQVQLQQLVTMRREAAAQGVRGTPTFFVNGTMVHAHNWAELEPFLARRQL